MSDASQGPGWWVASDGKWYPTERHSDVNLPEPLEAPSAAGISDPTALPVLRAKGVNSEIEVSGEWITIRRKLGAKRQHQGQAETRIRIADVTGVQFRAATMAVNGYIAFTVANQEPIVNVSRSANSILFLNVRGRSAQFVAIKNHLEARISPQRSVDHVPTMKPPMEVADELRKLAELRSNGILSDDEFQREKLRLLGA